MIILRNSFFSEKKKSKLRDIPHGTHGLSKKSLYSPSLGELTGRKIGMEAADEMDDDGKDALEILDKSPKEAKKAGKITGSVVGGGVGLITGLEARKYLRKASGAVGNPYVVSNLQDKILEASQNVKGNKIREKIVNKAKKTVEKIAKDPEKASKNLKRAGVPIAIALTGMGAYHGMKTGGKKAEKATREGNLERLIEKHKRNKE